MAKIFEHRGQATGHQRHDGRHHATDIETEAIASRRIACRPRPLMGVAAGLTKKRRRAAALHDARRLPVTSKIREASWTAPVLWRFYTECEKGGIIWMDNRRRHEQFGRVMVDRESRAKLAKAIHSYMDEEITAFQFGGRM